MLLVLHHAQKILMFSNALSMMPCEGRLHAALATFATFANGAGRSSDAPPAALVQTVRVCEACQ
jgi:hypothetical protein